MRNKRALFLTLFLLIGLVLITNSVAAIGNIADYNITITSPISAISTLATDTNNFSFDFFHPTFTTDTEAEFLAFVYISSPSTANSTTTTTPIADSDRGFSNVTSSNVNGAKNVTFRLNASTSGVWYVQDSNDYTFNITIGNGTFNVSTVITSFVVDFTIPTAPSSLSPSAGATDTGASLNFSSTVVDARTTSCTLNFVGTNFGGSSQAMTQEGSSCSLILTDIPAQSYQWFIQASDGSNTTNSAVNTINVQAGGGRPLTPQRLEQLRRKGAVEGNIGFIIFIIAIIIALAVIMRKK